jgi:hypothetical protein
MAKQRTPNQDAAGFVLGQYRGDGAFAMSPSSEACNLLSTCFGVLAFDLVGWLGSMPKTERARMVDRIRACQNAETGAFFDASFDQPVYGAHSRRYIEQQCTDFAVMALDILGAAPAHPLRLDERYHGTAWLDGLNWADPWLVSNEVMFVLNALLRDARPDAADAILDWLDAHQDPRNGCWNLGHRASTLNQMAGAFHFLIFHAYLGRTPRHVERIVDTVLMLQDRDGLFSYPGGGGSCEDLDAVDLLCRAAFYTDYRRSDIQQAMARAYPALWANQNPDGGFCWAKRNRLSLRTLAHAVRPDLWRRSRGDFKANLSAKLCNQWRILTRAPEETWTFSGIETTRLPLSASDLWSTWFRLLAIASIEKTFPEIASGETFPWRMRTGPGLGFYRR